MTECRTTPMPPTAPPPTQLPLPFPPLKKGGQGGFLLPHLETLSQTPEALKRLRELILELAVTGRLVASDGKVQELRVDAFCSVQGGIQKTPLRAPVKHHFPYLRVANVQRGRIDTSSLERYELLADELDRWRLAPGDLLIVEGNGSESEIGRCAIWRGEVADCVFQNHLMRVRPGPNTSVEFLALYLNSPVGSAHMRRLAITTSGLFNLSVGKIRSIPVRLPPLPDQHRIVAKVDELMALCDRLEARQQDAEAAHARLVQALLDSLTQARDGEEFQACWQRVAGQFPMLFTTPASVNGLWSAVLCLAAEGKLVAAAEQVAQLPIGELLLGDTLNGCSYRPSDTPVGIPILRISAGTGSDDFIVDETDHKWVEVTAAEREKFRLQPNDLLACRFNGNLHYVGAFALYNGACGAEQIFPDKLIRFRVDNKRALPGYLRFVMNALPARQQIESFCATTVGNIGISATNLKTVKVRVPSLDEQHRIVAKVTELLALCDQLKARIAAARAKHAQLAEALVAQAVAV